MERKLVKTEDGSDTFFIPELNEHYHSTFGAVQESNYIFLENGLRYWMEANKSQMLNAKCQMLNAKNLLPNAECHILEVGFGTGLNALLTWMESERVAKKIIYTSIEPFPLDEDEWTSLNYPDFFCTFSYRKIFNRLHFADWGNPESISPFFSLQKIQRKIQDYSLEPGQFDLIYFDAFGPDVQRELWTETVFRKMYESLRSHGVLVTYSSKGMVKRAMKAAGFAVEKLPGPVGKREIIRAIKNI